MQLWVACVHCHSHAGRPPAACLLSPHRKLRLRANNFTNDIDIPPLGCTGPAYPHCFVLAGGMELHGHQLRNSGSIHIRLESGCARSPSYLHQTERIRIRDNMRCLPSEWGVLSFAIMLLMEANVPPLPLAEGDQLLFGGGSGVRRCWFPTLQG